MGFTWSAGLYKFNLEFLLFIQPRPLPYGICLATMPTALQPPPALRPCPWVALRAAWQGCYERATLSVFYKIAALWELLYGGGIIDCSTSCFAGMLRSCYVKSALLELLCWRCSTRATMSKWLYRLLCKYTLFCNTTCYATMFPALWVRLLCCNSHCSEVCLNLRLCFLLCKYAPCSMGIALQANRRSCSDRCSGKAAL